MKNIKKQLVTNAKMTKQNADALTYTDAAEYLKKHKLKVTPGRMDVIAVCTKNHKPLTVEEIHSQLKFGDLDIATVYRTVETLVKIGLLKEVQFKDEFIRYELAHADHHHHAVCVSCGTVEDISDESLEHSITTTSKKLKEFRIINDHSVELFGFCKKCSA